MATKVHSVENGSFRHSSEVKENSNEDDNQNKNNREILTNSLAQEDVARIRDILAVVGLEALCFFSCGHATL